MTKTEFYEYVKSFNKNPGEYTEDEVYKICVAHKELVSGKSWREVVDLLGVDKTPDALRSWTFRQQEAAGTAKRNLMYLSDKTASEVTDEDVEETFRNKLDELYVEKQKVRDSYNAYRRTLRDEARIQTLKEGLTEVMAKLPALKKVEAKASNKQTEEAILLLSDLHIGVECDNYYNKYNSEIAAERLTELASKTVTYCKINSVKTLHILNLGDMIHGLIHTSARLEQELDVTEQIITASELLSQFLNVIQKAAPVITYRSVTDNHSRSMANLKEHIEKENFCKIIDWYLEERLKDTGVQFMHDNIDDGIGMFTLDCGKKIMFSHGHLDRKQTVIQDMTGLVREVPDIVFLAHYHNSAEHTFQGTKLFVNGSIVGTEQYAFGKRLFSGPEQKLMIIDSEDIQDITITLK